MAASLETLHASAEPTERRPILLRLLSCDVEGLSLVASVGWCVILLAEPGLFQRTQAFAAMAALGTQAHWSLGFAISAILQGLGILDGVERFRLLGSLVGTAQWTFIALMISTSGVTTGLAVYLPLAVMIALRSLRRPDET